MCIFILNLAFPFLIPQHKDSKQKKSWTHQNRFLVQSGDFLQYVLSSRYVYSTCIIHFVSNLPLCKSNLQYRRTSLYTYTEDFSSYAVLTRSFDKFKVFSHFSLKWRICDRNVSFWSKINFRRTRIKFWILLNYAVATKCTQFVLSTENLKQLQLFYWPRRVYWPRCVMAEVALAC